jgi:5-methylcytosine-specific restriction endonuclease McrA
VQMTWFRKAQTVAPVQVEQFTIEVDLGGATFKASGSASYVISAYALFLQTLSESETAGDSHLQHLPAFRAQKVRHLLMPHLAKAGRPIGELKVATICWCGKHLKRENGRCDFTAQTGQQSAAQRGYDRKWEKYRNGFLREFMLCGMRPGNVAPVMSRCRDENRATIATRVDHVIPHRGDGGRFWDRGNHQAMCASCHARKSNGERMLGRSR